MFPDDDASGTDVKPPDERELSLPRLVRAQEEERAQIASTIHDDQVQAMTAVLLRLGTMEISRPELADDEDFQALSVAVTSAIESLRELMSDLRPQASDAKGLAAALRLYLESRQAPQNGPSFDFRDELTSEPPPHVRVILYRIAQEALTNVRKHSRASYAWIVLDNRGRGYGLTVRDDGIGFDRLAAGYGSDRDRPRLRAMTLSAEAVGGRCRIESEPGRGTTVDIWVPGEAPIAAEDLL